jgi:hypothetical protein
LAVGGVKPVTQLEATIADGHREAAVEADQQQRQLTGFRGWIHALGAMERRAVLA